MPQDPEKQTNPAQHQYEDEHDRNNHNTLQRL